MVGFTKNMVERLALIKKLVSEGKSKKEIKTYLSKEFGYKKDKFYRTWASFQNGVVVGHSRPIFKNGYKKTKKYVTPNGFCWFCSSKKTIEHHVSYNPEKIVYICEKCHSKLHFITEDYHTQNKNKDDRLTYIDNHLLKMKSLVEDCFKEINSDKK